MNSAGFVKNHKILEEHSKVPDLLACGNNREKISKKILSLQGASVYALVGPFGSGKSTTLNHIMEERKTITTEKWIEFDAWKYPDRKDLWEGFVLDVAKQLGKQKYSETEKKIKGRQKDDAKEFVKTFARIPGLAVLEGFNHFLETSPATRVDEIQKILEELLNQADKDLIIIVEDIDRSGDAGVFFLETLKQFLRTANLKHKVSIIVPMANASYQKNLDSYLKCIDVFDFYNPPEIHLDSFVDAVFDDHLFEGEGVSTVRNKVVWTGAMRKQQTVKFLEAFLKTRPETTMRLIKLIIRKADLVYRNQMNDGQEPDFRVTLCIEASKYYQHSSNSGERLFDIFRREGHVKSGNIFHSFLMAILSNQDNIEESHMGTSIKFIHREKNDINHNPSWPWQYDAYGTEERYGLGMASFYADY